MLHRFPLSIHMIEKRSRHWIVRFPISISVQVILLCSYMETGPILTFGATSFNMLSLWDAALHRTF